MSIWTPSEYNAPIVRILRRFLRLPVATTPWTSESRPEVLLTISMQCLHQARVSVIVTLHLLVPAVRQGFPTMFSERVDSASMSNNFYHNLHQCRGLFLDFEGFHSVLAYIRTLRGTECTTRSTICYSWASERRSLTSQVFTVMDLIRAWHEFATRLGRQSRKTKSTCGRYETQQAIACYDWSA